MNIIEMIDDLKMDKKTYKKLSKGSAYDEVYEPIVDVALGVASDLEKSEELLQSAEEDVRIAKNEAREAKELLQSAEEDVRIAKNEARESKKLADKANERADNANERADKANERADKATERAESAENKVNEAWEIQNECKTALKLVDDEINFKVAQRETAMTKVSDANEEFTRAMGENLTLAKENSDIAKATVNTDNEEFAKAFEGFKKSRMDENKRQMGLNKESASKMRDKSGDYRAEVEGYGRRIEYLKKQRDLVLIEYAKANLNLDF